MATDKAAVERFLTHRVAQVVERSELERMLVSAGRPLRAKIGFDPTSPDLHIGHAVLLERVRAWQELGNTAVLVVGDTTAQIGDPSERNATRPMLSAEQVRANAETYLAQFHLVVDPARTEVRWQSEWFGAFGLKDIFALMAKLTVARMIERDTFAKRLADGVPVSMHETLYPFLQAYDSVAVEADLEMGGTDQTYNLLVGRDVQRDYGQPPQQILTCELLVGTDGVAKMSKSLGNAIGLTDTPYDQYARAMSIPDELMDNWAHLVTRWSDAEADAFVASLSSGQLHAKAAKQRLAREIVTRWHSEEAALSAEREWERAVGHGEGVAELPELQLPRGTYTALLVGARLAGSNSEARRLVAQGGVRRDGRVVTDADASVESGEQFELRVGKRRGARITIV
ncbi:MAG TPA: tyrosine--tRNA ligase [Candidatus Limnocylindria bacterium]|nr:tyrosine--tRNA ligase [Candidatus Limnocylindria bacterium]